MLKRNKISRLLSFVVIIAMVLVSIPVKEVKADESSQDVFIITSFGEKHEKLPEKKTYVRGTKISEMEFPAEWTVEGYFQSDENKTLTEDTLKDLVWKGSLKGTAQDETVLYSNEAPAGEYIFVLQLADNVKAEDEAELPSVTIKITEPQEETKPEAEMEPEETKPETEKAETEPEETKPEAEKAETEPEETKPEEEKAETEPEETKPEEEKAETEPEETKPEAEKAETEPEETKPEPEKEDPEIEPQNVQQPEEPLVVQENPEDLGDDTPPIEEKSSHLVITKTLPERIIPGTYKIEAQVTEENADAHTIKYEIPEEFKEIAEIDSEGNLKVLRNGKFAVIVFCTDAEESAQMIEREAVLPETDAALKTFSFVNDSWIVEITHGTDKSNGLITITVPYNTDVTKLAPVITAVSEYAKVSPASGTEQDFSKKVVYTVTAEDGVTNRIYDVEVKFVCTHEWIPATCTEPAVCKICKEKKGEPLGHDWTAADCTAPETCRTCKLTRGEALGHQWTPADCTTPETCSRCKVTRGSALGHNWGNWYTVKMPTTKEGGIQQRGCSRCPITEQREIPRLNIIGKPENNKVTGIKNKGIYRVDQLLTITAYGDGMDIQNPIANDVRYLPIGWKVTTYYKFTQAPYQVSFSVKSEGDYQLQVYFQKQIYDGKNWISQKETDVRKVNFTISNSKIMPVKTGDETPFEFFVLTGAGALAVLAAGLGWMIKRRKYGRS